MVVSKDALFEFIEKGLGKSKAHQIEIVALSKLLRVVRFANSTIHQAMEECDVNFFIRVLIDGKMGYASVNGLKPENFFEAIKIAEINAALPQSECSITKFASPSTVPKSNGYVEATASMGTDALEEKTNLLLEQGKDGGVTFAGVFWSLTGEMAVLNSNGVKLYHPWTAANCQTVATKGELAGFSAEASPDVREIDPAKVGANARDRAIRFLESKALPPGEYECLLENYAVAELLLYLGHMAFTADAVEDGRSVIGSKKGEKIASDLVSIWDDGTNPKTFQLPFDTEGMPRQKVDFINRGIGKEVVYDLMTANRFGAQSTGHALPADYSEGPFPMHIEMAAGDLTKEEMLKKMKRGLLITRFHYIREVHALKTMITGMTRDGVFLVENGAVVARVKNFRFTESILRAFSHVKAISKDRKLIASDIDGGLPSAILAPKLLVEKFTFTGSTAF